jgi:hypothetical protein
MPERRRSGHRLQQVGQVSTCTLILDGCAPSEAAGRRPPRLSEREEDTAPSAPLARTTTSSSTAHPSVPDPTARCTPPAPVSGATSNHDGEYMIKPGETGQHGP